MDGIEGVIRRARELDQFVRAPLGTGPLDPVASPIGRDITRILAQLDQITQGLRDLGRVDLGRLP